MPKGHHKHKKKRTHTQPNGHQDGFDGEGRTKQRDAVARRDVTKHPQKGPAEVDYPDPNHPAGGSGPSMRSILTLLLIGGVAAVVIAVYASRR